VDDAAWLELGTHPTPSGWCDGHAGSSPLVPERFVCGRRSRSRAAEALPFGYGGHVESDGYTECSGKFVPHAHDHI